MKFSSFCLPTFKEVPSDVKLKSHELMIRSGMIRMETSGIYTWLPLGLRVLNKINDIIIKEHQKFNINQILMPTIQSAEIWKKSERYDSYGAEMLKIKDRHEKELVYGPTNEEMMTIIGSNVIRSPGGDGIYYSITGSSVLYSHGGNAGGVSSSQNYYKPDPTALGSGGRGAVGNGGAGGAGYNGIVIVAYKGPQRGTGGTIDSTSRPGYTLHKFTTPGPHTFIA